MRARTPLTIIALSTVLALAAGGSALADGPGVTARNGDRLTATIETDDLDGFAIDLSEGGRLSAKLKVAKGAFLLPQLRLFRPNGSEFDLTLFTKKAGTAKPQLKNVPVVAGETGTWRLTIEGGNTGGYTAQFIVKTPTAAKSKGLVVPAGGTLAFTFTADEAAALTAKIKEKGGPELAGVRVLDPSGNEVAGTAAAFVRKKTTLASKKTPLTGGFGRYTIELTGSAEGPTTVDVITKVKFAKIAKRKDALPPEARLDSVTGDGIVRQEDVGTTVRMAGANLLAGSTAFVGGDGVTVTAVDVLTSSTVDITVDVDDDAVFGLRDVTICPPPLFGEPFTITEIVTVQAPDPTVTGFSIAAITQGDAGIAIELTGTGFRDGGTVLVSETGVTAGVATVVSPTTARANLTVALDAPATQRSVRWQQPADGGSAIGTAPGLLRVFNPNPSLTNVTPDSAARGATSLALTLTGQHFRDGGTVTAGAGVTVLTASRLSDSQLTATVNVSGAADFGPRDVVYRQPSAGGGASVTLDDGLAIVAPAPTVTSASPTFLSQGDASTTVTITGADFVDGGALSFAGDGLTVGATMFVSATMVEADVAVNASASTGGRNVTYTQPVGVGGRSATGVAILEIHAPPPTFTDVTPDSFAQGTGGTFVLTGTNFTNSGSVTTDGVGITLSSPTFVSGTEFRVDYTASQSATIGTNDLTFTQSLADGGGSATLVDAYAVEDAGVQLTDVSPSLWLPGQQRISVELTGLEFNTGTTVSISGSGVTLHSTTRNSNASITLVVSVDGNATVGQRDLTVTPGAGGKPQRTFDDALTIIPARPHVTAFSHGTLGRGASSVAVTVSGTNFRSGDTLSASGTGLTFASVSVVSAAQITANVSVTAGATLGTRDITVTHAATVGGVAGTLDDATSVIAAAPTVTSMNASSIGRTGTGGATRNVPVEVTGTNFMTGATLSFAKSGGSGVSVVASTTVVVSATKLRATLAITGAATTGLWDVTVTNPSTLGNSGTTGNGKLDVKSETTLTVNNVTPNSGGTFGGERVTIYGAGFTVSASVDFGTVTASGTQVIDQNTIIATVPQPATSSASATTVVNVKVTLSGGGNATLTNGYTYARDVTTFLVEDGFPADGATGVVRSIKRSALRLSAPIDTTSATYGTGTSNGAFWFESGSFGVSGGALAFGPNKRWLVFTRTGGSLAASKRHIVSLRATTNSIGSTDLSPTFVSSTTVEQIDWTTHATTTDTTAPTLSTVSPASAATNVSTTTRIALTFNEEIDPSSLASNVQLETTVGATLIASSLSISDNLKTVTLVPDAELATSTSYTIRLKTGLVDFSGNAIVALTRAFTTNNGTDSTAPTIDSVVIEELPAGMDGSTTYVNASGVNTAFDAYLPRWGWKVVVNYSDEGGGGIDESSLSAKASVAVGTNLANAELGANFRATSTQAEWRIPSSTKFTVGDNVTLTFTIKDKAGTANTSTSKVITFDVVDRDTIVAAAVGADHDPFDARRTWVLRTDLDHYTATFQTQTMPSVARGVTTSASSNGISDFDETLRLVGLNSASMTTAAKATVDGSLRGTNDIMHQLFVEASRGFLRERYEIDEDGTRDSDSVDVEFLVRGEQGSLASLPTYSTTPTSFSANAYSEMSIGGTQGAESSSFTSFTTLGQGFTDQRNRREEANLNNPNNGVRTGIYLMGALENNVNGFNGSLIRVTVTDKFVAVYGGTPVGEHASDDNVLAGTFDRTTSVNTTHNARYDDIMAAVDLLALFASSTLAHEVGHSTGLVANGAPKTGLFGDAHENNTFTEATSLNTNTSGHLDFVGQDIMAAAGSFLDDTATGSNFARFNPMIRAFLRNRLVHDEGK